MVPNQAQSTIAIIGAGQVGMALAAALTRAGEDVIFGVRDSARLRDAGVQVPVRPTLEAIQSASTVIAAIPYAAALELARDGRVELRQDRAFGPIYLRSPPSAALYGGGEGGRR